MLPLKRKLQKQYFLIKNMKFIQQIVVSIRARTLKKLEENWKKKRKKKYILNQWMKKKESLAMIAMKLIISRHQLHSIRKRKLNWEIVTKLINGDKKMLFRISSHEDILIFHASYQKQYQLSQFVTLHIVTNYLFIQTNHLRYFQTVQIRISIQQALFIIFILIMAPDHPYLITNHDLSFKFRINLQLIDLIRSFKHTNHQYQNGYWEQIFIQLSNYGGTSESEQFQYFCEQELQLTLNQVLFQIHYYIAVLDNLEELINIIQGEQIQQQLKSIPIQQLNSTNIFTIHALKSQLKKLNHAYLNEQENHLKPKYLDFYFFINVNTFKNDQDGIQLNIDTIALGIKANGKLDLEICHHLATLLNQRFNINLHHYLILQQEMIQPKLIEIQSQIHKYYFDKELFKIFRKQFVLQHQNIQLMNQFITQLEQYIKFYITINQENHYIEKLLIGLLGHQIQSIRDQGNKLLTILYNQNEFPQSELIISQVNTKFIIQDKFENINQLDLRNLIIRLQCFIFILDNEECITSFHKPHIHVENNISTFTLNLGKFTRSGFYDWSLIDITQQNKCISFGRYIIHPENTRSLSCQEIGLDGNKLSFCKVQDKLQYYKRIGINCLYLRGALERDNGYNQQRPNAPTMEFTSRNIPNKMLGGQQEFTNLVNNCKDKNIKVIVDILNNISLVRPHRKYKQHLISILNQQGIEVKTQYLNSRKKRVWDLYINEVEDLIENYQISGIICDIGYIYPINQEEMERLDVDGEQAYSIKEIFNGNICENLQDKLLIYPLFVKLCKKLWSKYPNFLIISECIQDDQTNQLISVGTIPKQIHLSEKIQTIFKQEGKNVNILKKQLEKNTQAYSQGSIVISSTTHYTKPFPAFLFKSGTWNAISLSYLLPYIPMSTLEEEEGQIYRDQTISEESKQQFRQDIGPEFGFDINLIGRHYNYLREIRQQHEVLRTGLMVSLSAEDKNGLQNRILTFGRYSCKELAIIVLNFSTHESDSLIVLRNFGKYFENYMDSDIVVRLRNWSNPEKDNEDINYYFIGEFLCDHLQIKVNGYGMYIFGVDIYPNDPEKKQLADKCSLNRLSIQLQTTIDYKQQLVDKLKEIMNIDINRNEISMQFNIAQLLQINDNQMTLNIKVDQNKFSTIYSNDKARSLELLTEKCNSLQTFINGFGYFYREIIQSNHFNLNQLISQMKIFQSNQFLQCKLYAFFHMIIDQPSIKLPFYSEIKDLLAFNQLGPIVICLEHYTENIQNLAEQLYKLEEEVYIIMPYKQNGKHLFNFTLTINSQQITIGVFQESINGVKIYQMHNEEIFNYNLRQASFQLRQLVVFAKGTLEMLCQLHLIPSLIVTIDWFSGLIPAYLYVKAFGDSFIRTKSFHLINNLDQEGRIYPLESEGTLDQIHQLPSHLLVDSSWQLLVLNPSRCALLTCHNWGTTSNSYKQHILSTSPLAPLLQKYTHSFAQVTGIAINKQLELMQNYNHHSAKQELQERYFNYIDESIMVLTVTQCSTLILDIVEELISQTNRSVQILIAPENKIAAQIPTLQRLIGLFPNNFAITSLDEKMLILLGADFGLIANTPSPNDTTQQYYFVAGTPVVAYKNGIFKDTVQEFDQAQLRGCGLTFEQLSKGELLFALHRAWTIFQNSENYQILRENAFKQVIDISVTARGWLQEFYRMFTKKYIDKKIVKDYMKQIRQDFSIFREEQLVHKIEGTTKIYQFSSNKNLKNHEQIHQFIYRPYKIPMPKQVFLVLFKENKQIKYELTLNQASMNWETELKLNSGEHIYKYLVDNEWSYSEDDFYDNDLDGNINNYVLIQ